ncbi:MAG: T9SS type A sorting domain-containing protein, partial [Bacteroidota bacterium]
FGFYEDSELTRLIKKGKQLVTELYDKIYVVSLDDGLPGMPIEVNVSSEKVDLEIEVQEERVGQKNQISLSAKASSEISTYQWYLDGKLVETVEKPILFLDDETYEITLAVGNPSGCLVYDTLKLDFTPPLSVVENQENFVYPNPTKDELFFRHQESILEVQILSLDGKILFREDNLPEVLNVSFLARGTYIMKISMKDETINQQLIIE